MTFTFNWSFNTIYRHLYCALESLHWTCSSHKTNHNRGLV